MLIYVSNKHNWIKKKKNLKVKKGRKLVFKRLKNHLFFIGIFNFLGWTVEFKHVLFHSCLHFLDFLGQVIHFCKVDEADLMEINLKVFTNLFIIYNILTCLRKKMTKKVPWKLSSKPKTSHFTIYFKATAIAFKFDPSFFTYPIMVFFIHID